MIFNIFAYWDQVSPRDPILEKDMIPENDQIPFEGSDSLEDPDLNFEDPIRESCRVGTPGSHFLGFVPALLKTRTFRSCGLGSDIALNLK